MSTKAYNTIKQEYKQHTLNATQAGELVMSYAEWLEKYRGECPEDVDTLTDTNYNYLEDINQFIY